MDDKIMQLKKWIDESDNVVFFGGAGVSTESGIPDFRSVDGLYNQNGSIRPKRYSATRSLPVIPRSITDFTGKSSLSIT